LTLTIVVLARIYQIYDLDSFDGPTSGHIYYCKCQCPTSLDCLFVYMQPFASTAC